MKYLQNTVLLIIGGGDVIGKLKEMVKKEHLEEKVIFIPKQHLECLIEIHSVCRYWTNPR